MPPNNMPHSYEDRRKQIPNTRPLHYGDRGKGEQSLHSVMSDGQNFARKNSNGFSFFGYGKSVLLTIIDLLPVKPDSPYSTALLKHYVEGSGEPYELKKIPGEWQDWIVKTTRAKTGVYKELDPYNSGLYDLRNSLGHFDVTVAERTDKRKEYTITDTYCFGYMENDKYQKGRHGFPLGQLDDKKIELLRKLLPKTEYQNPGGFKEHWEIKKVGKDTIIYIPQQFLVSQGKEFQITGKFVY